MSTLEQDITWVRAWHSPAPDHDCPARTYVNLADATERLLAENADLKARVATRGKQDTVTKIELVEFRVWDETPIGRMCSVECVIWTDQGNMQSCRALGSNTAARATAYLATLGELEERVGVVDQNGFERCYER